MMTIRTRNQQVAVPMLLQTLYEGEQHNGSFLVDSPVVFTFERPRERLIFWPGIRRNPGRELQLALRALQPSESKIAPSVLALRAGGDLGFLFSTPVMAVTAGITEAGRLDLYAMTTDTNPFTGAFGHLGLQLSLLQELMAQEGRVAVGELNVQHQRMHLPVNAVNQLRNVEPPENPYTKLWSSVRKIDGPLDIKNLLEGTTLGLKSKWARHVGSPALRAGAAETREDALRLAETIKADDWRRSMLEWIEVAKYGA